jgi:hypothetical protein
MAKRKLEINKTEEELKVLYDSLKTGAPLPLALQRAGISLATYYYWVAIACIVINVKSKEEIEEMEELAKSGVNVSNVRDLAQLESATKKSSVGVYIEPSAEGLLRYKTSRKFRAFADDCYKIVTECNKLRSDFAVFQLNKIARSTDKKSNINPSGAMWFLERTIPDYFAKPSDKAKDSEMAETSGVPAIEVEFIDPNTSDQRERLLDMESKLLTEQKPGGNA